MTETTCHFVTLGCRVNQYETQLVKETLLKNGFREAANNEPARLCFVNTCTVTATGDAKSRQLIRRLARRNPGTRTIVMGCYATRDPEALARLPGVWEVVTDKRELPDLFDRLGLANRPTGISEFDGRQRATVKVQDGCILHCSYCIIPHVRSHLISRPAEEIEDEVRRLVGNGYKEIVVSGVHVGHYGVDTTREKLGVPRFRLGHLIRQLDRIPGDWRMRLSSIEAAEMDDEFLAIAADCEHLCPHLHPSLQSGSNNVLRRMRRRYTSERFLDTMARLRGRLDRPALTTDVIVGFPGETEADFEQTMAVCREAAFTKIHIFPFSARKGTHAATLPDQIPHAVRKERCDRLAGLECQLAVQYYSSLIGQRLEVLIEREFEGRPGWMRGTDRRYVPVALPGNKQEIGTFVEAVGSKIADRILLADRHEG